MIRTTNENELEFLQAFEITIPLFWYPQNDSHAYNEVSTKQGINCQHTRNVFLIGGKKSAGKN